MNNFYTRSKIQYKVNGYWHEIAVDGHIEGVSFVNPKVDELPPTTEKAQTS